MTDPMTDPILDTLNSEQRRAVLCKDGPVLIIAGAGSGKTRVLTSRIALLLREGVAPESILALTFTKKAAGEMRTRIMEMAGEPARRLVMGTFHSVFVRFLREWSSYIGFPANFTIYDAEDAPSCLKGCIGETLLGPDWNSKELLRALTDDQKKERKRLLDTYKTKDIASRISRYKNDYITPKDYKEDESLVANDFRKGWPQLGEIYDLYMRRCRKAGAMDFDDILVYTNYLLTSNSQAREQLSRRFRYILVDEYQDTNAVQYGIVRILSQAWGNICCVGDDSQSIYAFRGARIQNILNFRSDYPAHQAFKLETNYRSTPQIVEAANHLIANNENRLPKVCHADRPEGLPVETEYLRNDRDEARFIAHSIELKHRTGKPYGSCAVLYRMNAQSRAIEDALLRSHIPYTVYSGTSFFERMEVKDVIAWLRLVENPTDDEALKRICNKPARGISDATVTKLQARASKEDLSLWDTITLVLRENIVPGEKRKGAIDALYNFTSMIKFLRQETAHLDALEAAQLIIGDEGSGLYACYKKNTDDDGQRRTANIDELLNGIRYFIRERMDDLPDEGDTDRERYHTGLGDYLESIALMSAADTRDDGEDRVALMTSHCSKGLEFPTVFIAGVEEGLYPALRDNSTDFDLEEERRLFYVSVTRAKDELILTSCGERWKYGDTESCEASRFIDEMLSKP